MTRHPEDGRLHTILDALCLGPDDAAVRYLIDAFGGEPVEIHERHVGEPAVLSRHLLFESGGEIVLHDDAVSAVILHLTPTPIAPRGLDVSDWIRGIRKNATFDDVKKVFDVPWRFAAGDRYFVLEAGYARPEFVKYRDQRPGNLQRVVFTADDPKDACRPADEDCRACRDLIVREGDGSFDVDGTVGALIAGVEAGFLKEKSGSVALTDLRLLHASALMERVESQVSCSTCDRVACITLYRDSSPTFGYYPYDAAMRRPLQAIPPIEAWGDAARIAAARDAMRYVDHEPGSWFLVAQHDDLYLKSRYTINSMADDSSLIRLDESERRRYREDGHDYLTDLARRISSSSPHRESSPFHLRNLLRHPDDGRDYSEEVSAAIANHTWLARQKQAAAQRMQTEEAADA
ncbi:hypothetical protein [Microbacterium murale]|uniref:Uncharacterized protein n=1 Tax=Microbacterium murale TaxID=1081040 RepID=A0ABU0PBQ2_9MICO|nr:hypothetical protein [Microbacterium murale]MDQ0644776.1 hypothetical protein [Microbacterium murale]